MSDEVRHITVAPDDDGQRLDRWFKKHVGGMPWVLAQKLMRKGQIRVDGKRVKPDMRLVAGQEVRIPPFKPGVTSAAAFREHPGDADYIRNMVLYDNGDICVLNKPYGIAVQGGNRIDRHIDGLLEHLKDKNGVRPRLVHRLDRDTSGVLITARALKTVAALGRLLAGRDIRKEYWALVSPVPEMEKGIVTAPLAKGTGLMKDKILVKDREEDGQSAITIYRTLEHAGKQAAFVAFWPRTGRTHQIRVHAAHIGCPILGDEKYGAKAEDFADLGLAKRLHLHARRVVFRNPNGKGAVDVIAPLPSDLRASWQTLGFDPDDRSEPFAEIEGQKAGF